MPLSGIHTKNTTVTKLRECSVKSRFTRYSSVSDSDMLDELGWLPLYQRRQEAQLILLYTIFNRLLQVPFEGALIEAFKDTRRKHNMKFRQLGHTTSHYEQSFFTSSAWNGFSLAESPSLALGLSA